MDRKEINDILVSWFVLSVAFFFVLEGVGVPTLGVLVTYLFLVAVSFLSHEFGHRQVARKYGFQANYEMWPQGIILALVTSMIGFLFAAPGAVVIRQRGVIHASRRTLNKIGLRISIAGIVINLVLGVLLVIAFLFTEIPILATAAWINIWLAIFNLLPIPPLDGSKVLHYNKAVWAATFVVAIFIFMLLGGF